MDRVDVNPELLRWACARASLEVADLEHKFVHLADWVSGAAKPTLKQLEAFAKATHTPVGYLFLREPPVERIPIPDFRELNSDRLGRPSPDLLDTAYVCQQRQEWFRNYARSMDEQPLAFVGSTNPRDDVIGAAARMRTELSFDIEARRQMPTWTDALRHFIAQADDLGVLVMCNGVVHNNNFRRLDLQEFRGFAISDDLSPLVFINGADTKAGQMFTLAHELAHMWLGQSAVSNSQPAAVPNEGGGALVQPGCGGTACSDRIDAARVPCGS